MRADPIIERLKSDVSAFGGRIEGAAALAPLVAENRIPEQTPAAFVIPLGLDAGAADSMTGFHRQMMRLSWGVLIVISYAGDATGQDMMPGIDDLADQVRSSLTGFQPGEDGVLELKRERLVRLDAGTLFYQIDFAIDEQLRITR